MRSRSCNFQKNPASQPGALPLDPVSIGYKAKKSTCVPLKTLKLKVLWEEGTKLISIAKLHLEVLRVVKPKKISPAASVTDSLSLAQKRHHVAGSLRSHTDPPQWNILATALSAPAHHLRTTGHKIVWGRTTILTTTRYETQLDLTEHTAIRTRDPWLNRT